MTVTLYKWTIEQYHRAIATGLFDDQPVELLQGDLVLGDRLVPSPSFASVFQVLGKP
jgi:hypothetical protein